MADQTLPMKGGWIMVKEHAPIATKEGKPLSLPPLTLIYATPVKIFPADYFHIAFWNSEEHHFFAKEPLDLLYRERRGSKLDEFELERLRTARHRWQEIGFEEPKLEMSVRVQTENGDMVLNPNEFSIIESIEPYLETIGNEYNLVELGGFESKGKMADQMHYLRARGIPRIEAFKMVAGEVNKPGVFRLAPHPELMRYFGYEPPKEVAA